MHDRNTVLLSFTQGEITKSTSFAMVGKQRIDAPCVWAVGERFHKEKKQLGLRGNIELGVSMFAMQFHSFRGDRQLLGDETGTIAE